MAIFLKGFWDDVRDVLGDFELTEEKENALDSESKSVRVLVSPTCESSFANYLVHVILTTSI